MTRSGSFVTAFAVLFTGAFSAPEAAAQTSSDAQVTGRLWVEGGSTLRSWDCEAGALDVALTPANDSGVSIEGLSQAVSALSVQVPAQMLDCDNDTMNDHMWNALDVDEHPTIEFRMRSYDVASGEESPQVEAAGSFQLHGVARAIVVRADVTEDDDGLRVHGVHTLDMTDYGINPPRLMFGTLRVHEDVEVHFDLLVTHGASREDR